MFAANQKWDGISVRKHGYEVLAVADLPDATLVIIIFYLCACQLLHSHLLAS